MIFNINTIINPNQPPSPLAKVFINPSPFGFRMRKYVKTVSVKNDITHTVEGILLYCKGNWPIIAN